jgi:hypothetical protein
MLLQFSIQFPRRCLADRISGRLAMLHIRNGLVVPFGALILFCVHSPARADGPGVELHSTLQGVPMVTTLSAEGAVTTLTPAKAGAGPSFKAVVRYRDRTAWVADMAAKSLVQTSLADRFAHRREELAQVAAQRPHVQERGGVGVSASMRLLSDKGVLDGTQIQAVQVDGGGRSWRLWYATSLAGPPSDISSALAALGVVDANSKALAAKLAGQVLVRAEVKLGGAWKPIFETSSIRQVTARSSDLTPPQGFAGVPMRRPIAARPPGGGSVPANVIAGPGPEMGHPELYVVLWGKTLNDPGNAGQRAQLLTALNDMGRPQYTSFLSQYHVHGIKFNGLYFRPDLPPMAVGSSNFAAIAAMVYDVGFRDGAPIFWWEVGGHDPLYVLLVDDSEVDKSSWSGYHFVAGSLTHAVLPFPVSLFAHDAIPWAIAKIPHASASLPIEAALWRSQCRTGMAGVPAGTCDPLAQIDQGTSDASHEIVEAATDPYVFLGWSDPTHQPFWEESEIGDICHTNSAPWAKQTVVGLSGVSTYWSNADNACMPESRPAISVVEPTPGESVPAVGGQIVARATATDPTDGDISAGIRWALDGGPFKDTLGHAVFGGNVAGVTAPGVHTLEASTMNSQGLTRSTKLLFSVQSHPANITILSPPDGSTVGTQKPIILRGSAFHISPGDIPDVNLRWSDGGAPLGSGPLLASELIGVGDHHVQLSVVSGSATEGPASVTVHVTAASKFSFRLMITSPLDGSHAQVASGQSISAPVTLSAQILGSPGSAPTISWKSDLQGPLGTGPTISVPLKGSSCVASAHHITATAAVKGPRADQSTDTVTINVGQVC